MNLRTLGTMLKSASRRPSLWLGLVLSISIGRALVYYDFVPMWDSLIYGSCLAQAAVGDFHVAALNCAYHPTAGYFALLVFPLSVFGIHYFWVILVNALLGAAAVWAFHGILQERLPGRRYAVERLCATAALATHPLIVASTISVNPDYGVYCFFLLFLYALLRGQTVLPTVWGLCLAFSKEVGVLLYCLAIGVRFIDDLVKHRYPLRQWSVRIACFALPPAALGYHILKRTTTLGSGGGEGLWYGITVRQIIFDSLLRVDFDDPTSRAYMAEVFVAQFTWVAVILVLLGWVKRMITRLARFMRIRVMPTRPVLLSAVLLLGAAFLLTRFKTASNMRYFLAVAPLILWACCESLVALSRWRPFRIGALSFIAVLFLASSFRTLDPVSKDLFGTFQFGTHPMLSVASYVRECCCHARDQLVYNTEHTFFHYLQAEALSDLKPKLEAGAELVVYPEAEWHNIGPLLRSSMRRSLRYGLTSEANVINVPSADIVASRIRHGYFLALPNCDNPRFFNRLQQLFEVRKLKTYERRGYAIDLYELDKKT